MILYPFQSETLKALERPAHVICVAPTGAGKSLIYERFASNPDARTLLISPLIALARQQADRLRALHLPVFLGCGVPGSRPSQRELSSPSVWVVSPEKLRMNPYLKAQLSQWKPNFLVVDECHCLWEWGESFRPSYKELPSLIRDLGIPRSLWLTATLPPHARMELLKLLPSNTFELGRFKIPDSLDFEIVRVPWPNRPFALMRWLNDNPTPGLIFAPTRKSTARIWNLLKEARIPALLYHAGLSAEERRNSEELIKHNKVRVIVATTAFGLGMDILHLDWVLLWQAPYSLLNLAQQMGRVGRNGKKAKARLFWDKSDFTLLTWIGMRSPRSAAELFEVHCFLESTENPRLYLERYFNDPGVQNRDPSN